MDSDNMLLVVAVVAVAVSIVGISLTYNSINAFESILTGHAIENGTVNITISTTASINITTAGGTVASKTINWGAGSVTPGEDAAALSTNGSAGTCTNCETWSAIGGGFIIQNDGNVNVTLNVSSDMVANNTFIGGTAGGGPAFRYNITNYELRSCRQYAAGVVNGTFYDFTADTDTQVCTNFTAVDSNDTLRLDIFLRVPSDSNTGAQDALVQLSYQSV